MRCAVGFGLVFLLGCFDPGIAPLRCSEAKPACPDGLQCFGGVCQAPDSADASIDASYTDIGLADMSQSGCASGKGLPIGNLGCWGCPGVFDPIKKASSLCASGFAIPNNTAKLSDADCVKVSGGFFMSSVWGATAKGFSDLSFSQCGIFTMGEQGFFGCGSAMGSGTINPTSACNGFRQHLQCTAGNGIYCGKSDIDQITNSFATNGVICCN